MLATLSIRDIVIIDRLDIDFTPGLSALTGETGAGKSILLDAFSLALGGRGDAGLVRRGAGQGQVTAVFELPRAHQAHAVLAENDLTCDGELILRRIQTADGRTRAFVNDQPVSAQLLRSLGAGLVEIHGQHDDRALIDPATHRRLLDAFGGLDAQVAEVGRLWRERRDAGRALDQARSALASSEQEREYLSHSLEELDGLAPEAGEEDRLAERRHLMMEAEKIAAELAEALESVGGRGSPAPVIASALRRLERRADQFPDLLGPVVTALDQALGALEEARSAAEAAMRGAAFDPNELETAEERLFALRAAARKHQVSVDDLPALRTRFADALSEIAEGGDRVAALEAELHRASAAYDAAADDLGAARRAAAASLDSAVAAELPPLRLEQARFETRIEGEPDGGGPEGRERVEFWVETNPGAHPGPLVKVASGGELSRFMLALKVALADRGSAPTLVFDEIDTAVGGAVSDAIGARLARLAERVQVLTVTHAPQVAARAGTHFLIAKGGGNGGEDRVTTRVESLDAARRREEIARMLAGAVITDEARAAAGRLLAGTG
jgi:DNA repair protein RecN (Recombination protein N)